MKKRNPKQGIVLDEYEQKLEESFVNDNWVEVNDSTERSKAMTAAKLSKSERTNIRLSPEDFVGIRYKAEELGIGYQTLIASLVHQYVTGRLVEIDNALITNIVTQAVRQLSPQKNSRG